MENADFIAEPRRVCPLVLTYCADQLGVAGETQEQFYARVPFDEFWKKRNEGFKAAQELIFKNILKLETEIKELKAVTIHQPINRR